MNPEEDPWATRAGSVAFVALTLIVGYLLAGLDGVVFGVAVSLLLFVRRNPARLMAGVAFALVVMAAVSTVLEDQPAILTMDYPNRRVIAASVGSITGILLVVATVVFAVSERARIPAPPTPRQPLASRLARLRARATTAVPYVPVLLGAGLLRWAALPPALPSGYAPLLSNLRLAYGYSLTSPYGADPTGALPPLAPGLVAFAPIRDRLVLLAASMAIVVVVGIVGHVRFGSVAGVLAAAAAAVLPSLWDQQLPVALATLGVVVAVGVAAPRDATVGRAVAAGVALGLAALARPDALVALVVVASWSGVAGTRRVARVVTVVAVALLTMSPWLTFVWSEFGPPWPAESLAATLNDPLTPGGLVSPVAWLVGAGLVGATLACARTEGWDRATYLPYLVLPPAALVLALTDLPSRDPLTWSAGVVTVVLGDVVARQLGAGPASGRGGGTRPPVHRRPAVGATPGGAPNRVVP